MQNMNLQCSSFILNVDLFAFADKITSVRQAGKQEEMRCKLFTTPVGFMGKNHENTMEKWILRSF